MWSFHAGLKFIDKCEGHNLIPVFDRCRPISEYIYGSVLRGKPQLPYRVLMAQLDLMQPMIIYVRPPYEIMWERAKDMPVKDHKNEKHVKHVRENLHALTEAYDNLFNNLRHDMFVHILKDSEESIRELGLCVG